MGVGGFDEIYRGLWYGGGGVVGLVNWYVLQA